MFKILVLSHMYPNAFEPVGGVFVHEQAKELVRQGCQIKVVSPIPWAGFPIKYLRKQWNLYAKILSQDNLDGIDIYHPRYISSPGLYFYEWVGDFYYSGIRKIVNKIYRNFKFDLIHTHTAYPDGFAGLRLKKDYKVPLVVTVHGADVCSVAPYKPLIEINKRLKNKILEVFFKADKVIGVSSRVRNIILKYCNEPKRITYINDGIPESQIKEFKDSPQDDNKIKIISVGYLEKRKGHEFVIRAVANLIKEGFEPEYNIIGEGENFSSLKELVRQLDLFDRVKFLGLKTQDEVYRYLSQADIFCLPSWDEAFGVVYLEAMAARLPVIACKAQGIEDVIQDGINGLLAEPKDADSVEKLLKKLIENPQLRKDIAEKARLTVLNQFTWRTNVQKNIAVYAEILP